MRAFCKQIEMMKARLFVSCFSPYSIDWIVFRNEKDSPIDMKKQGEEDVYAE
ncbi:hypothetical protein [Chlamydia trachomatis]|uniref:hypothetical protein n=1 Tax=Chlamydia trachomatis TaxID=813 RepID=UPI0001B46F0E|nr:hypothetical protein [Chlamydia trachomatis]ADH17626.1 hypothetical protein E150_04385 [Chlamydia trachomatis E/150]ADH21318.1 hypothetical protein E11023_04350 [Chlamydia trachomatis E/11023]AGR99868.1 hypothetical protein CTRC342_04570 [Chlamydia trachomatis RC-F(s)/342]AGT64922.1 hypothetical protein O169_04585 [Chlamydia trachomatis]AGT65850.1 hypothetical protein O170_04570 [Chlamydia trachomatis]